MSQPLNPFTSVTPDLCKDAQRSDDFLTRRKRPPKLPQIKQISIPPEITNELTNKIDDCPKWDSLPTHFASRYMEPRDPPTLLPLPPLEIYKSPYSNQFKNCAKEILDDLDSLISMTTQEDLVSTRQTGPLPPVPSETVYSILGYAYQQQVSAAGFALERLASCKVEVAIAKSVSALSSEQYREQDQVHLHSIIDALDQTFPGGCGEKSISTNISSGMVEARVKARLRNFRKRVDKVLANSSILDWVMNSPQPQLPQHLSHQMSVISWMMAASSSSSSSSSSSEDSESQPVSAQVIRSQPRGLGSIGDPSDFSQSISDHTFNLPRPNRQRQGSSELIRSEPSPFKRKESDPSIATDVPSTSLDVSRSLGNLGGIKKSFHASEPPLNSSSGCPIRGNDVQMRTVRGRSKEPLLCGTIVEGSEQTESTDPMETDRTSHIIGSSNANSVESMPRRIRSVLKPVGSFEDPNKSLGKSVEFVREPPLPLGSLEESQDADEREFLEQAHNSMMGKEPSWRTLPFVAEGIPDLLGSLSVTANFLGSSYFAKSRAVQHEANLEQEWRTFQLTFKLDEFSSEHRLRQSMISLNRRIEDLHKYSRGMTDCLHSLTKHLPEQTAADKEEDFYNDLSLFNSLLEDVVGTSHTLGVLTQEYKDNSCFRLCLEYVDKLKGNSHAGSGGTNPTSSTLPSGTGSATGLEGFVLNEESVQTCIEQYISQPAQAMKWPSFHAELSRFAAHQAQVDAELSAVTKQYKKLVDGCKGGIDWHKFAMKLLFVIMFLLLLLIYSSESFEKSIRNILVNLRLI